MTEPGRRKPRNDAFARWPRWRAVQRFRESFQLALLFPTIWLGYSIEVRGRHHLAQVEQPCLVISNHTIHLDWSMILRALPRRFRLRTAVAAAADDIFGNRARAFTGRLFGNAFPFDRDGGGIRESLEHVNKLLNDGWNVLIFPEGERSETGEQLPFKSGIGWLAVRSGKQVLPMRVDLLRRGTYEGRWMLIPRGRARVTIGAPIRISPEASYKEAVALLELAVLEA